MRGIHLMWMGPREWVFSPGGWDIQRRKSAHRTRFECVEINSASIQSLQKEHELRCALGVLTYRRAPRPIPLTQTTVNSSAECDVVRLELDEKSVAIRVQILLASALVIAYREKKAVRAGSVASSGQLILSGSEIDCVDVYLPKLTPFTLCADATQSEKDLQSDWSGVPYLVQNLQLPLTPLQPGINEYSLATSRLLSGESIDPQAFKRITALLRPCVIPPPISRPVDQVLLARLNVSERFEEAGPLDSLLISILSPVWRRAMGLGWFDRDPQLQPGATYDYRITGRFPDGDLHARMYNFATIPTQTDLPVEFFLGDVRLRLPQPGKVVLRPGSSQGLVQLSQRGVRLAPRNQNFWAYNPVEDCSLVIDFSQPVSKVVLFLGDVHDLKFKAGANSPLTPLPGGTFAELSFFQPTTQLRLFGTGFFAGLRVVTGLPTLVPRSAILSGIQFVDTPRLTSPVSVNAHNLQRPLNTNTSLDDSTSQSHVLGFNVTWTPKPDGVEEWPSETTSDPPHSAIAYAIEHRTVNLVAFFPYDAVRDATLAASNGQPPSAELLQKLGMLSLPPKPRDALIQAVKDGDLESALTWATVSTSPWAPLVKGDNLVLGTRIDLQRERRPRLGADLSELNPVLRFPDGYSKSFSSSVHRDVFNTVAQDADFVQRNSFAPGTFHQYSVRAIDVIGRASLVARKSTIARLEKHRPPPMPEGPIAGSADQQEVQGVHARVLVKGAPDLTPEEQAILGDAQNAIILKWGWHARQRQLDPLASEFRIYLRRGHPLLHRAVLSNPVELGPGQWRVSLAMDEPVALDAAKGLTLHAGHPFQVLSNTAGSAITADLQTRVPPALGKALAKPQSGPVAVPKQSSSDFVHPHTWKDRIAVIPLNESEAYQQIFFNLLELNDTNSLDELVLGVSTADSESYVPDTFPGQTRAGNESAIISVTCKGQWVEKPLFQPSVQMAHAVTVIADQPCGESVEVRIDLAPSLGWSGLIAGAFVYLERASAMDVIGACYVDEDGTIMARSVDPRPPNEVDVPISVTPEFIADIRAALQSPDASQLRDNQLVYLAGIHPFRDRFFKAQGVSAETLGDTVIRLSTAPDRHVVRARLADRARNVSSGSAVARVVIHVPSPSSGVATEKLSAAAGDGPDLLRLRIPRSRRESHLLLFTNTELPKDEVELRRIANRMDLFPNDIVRVRLSDGTLLIPVVKSLKDADVVPAQDGGREVALQIPCPPGACRYVWACTLTPFGVPSILAGPWMISTPPLAVPEPEITASVQSQQVLLIWSWPTQLIRVPRVAVEISNNGTTWKRLTAPLPKNVTQYTLAHSAGTHLRLSLIADDGRVSFSHSILV